MFQKGIAETFDVDGLFTEVARDSGLPLFERLSKGPQSRTERIPRPLAAGGSVDIYTAILMAIAATGPRETLNYDQIRTSLNTILAAKTPQKNEVTNALNQLSSIDKESNKGGAALDWDSENLNLAILDPFFRFYLRWEVSPKTNPKGRFQP